MATKQSILGLFTLCWGLVACSSNSTLPPEPEKCKLQVLSGAILASPRINPTTTGEPRPVQLRLYQLKNDTSFLNSTFEQIWQDDKTALGDALVKSDELTIYPDTRTEFKFKRDDAAQFLTAAALFREPKGRTWFTSFELPPPPTAGSCGAKCTGPECADAGAEQDYRIYIWLDGMLVQEGSEHAESFPPGRVVNADGSTSSTLGLACDTVKNKGVTAAEDAVKKPVEAQLPTNPIK
jgi:type VI secretion system protein VasD